MTLTLDEVRKTRFHMARRQGYEVTDVDNFVDKVEATLQAMSEENETLKKQITVGDAKAAPAAAPVADPRMADDNKRLAAELEAARKDNMRLVAEFEAAGKDNMRLAGELEAARKDAGVPQDLQNALKRSQEETERLRQENATLRQQLAEAENKAEQATPVAPVAAAAVAPVVAGGVQKLVVTTSSEASPAVTRLVELATQQAEQVVSEAEAEAKRKLEDANRQAHEITVDARTKAERVESEARVNAERATAEAQSRANALDSETAAKRNELFVALEKERDELKSKVADLRGFEGDYRSNLTSHLKSQIEAIETGIFEPDSKPGLLNTKTEVKHPDSVTPRLDALLGDQH